MKITMILLMLLALFLPNTFAEDYTQSSLPEGAVARLGKGKIEAVRYSPDGTRLAVVVPPVFGSMKPRLIRRSPCSLGIRL